MKKTIALAAATVLGLLVGPARATHPGAGVWLAGDLHVHTTYSHDSWDPVADDNTGPDEFYTLGQSVERQFAIAASRGLHYLAITDHNDTRSVSTQGFGGFGVVGVRGYENSLHGHAQMLGTGVCYGPAGPVPGTTIDCNDHVGRDAQSVQAMADSLRADGGVFQINHPVIDTADPAELDWRLDHAVVPDTVEVWNISPIWQPPMPSGSNHDAAIEFWEAFLNAGHKVGATGGSDNHWASTTAVQGVGQPTTWVYASHATEAGILEGIRAGRTFVSLEPPNYGGARVFLEADPDGDGVFEAMVGDTVPPGSAFRVRLENAPPGSEIHAFTSAGPWAVSTVLTDAVTLTAPEGATWMRVELQGKDELRSARAEQCDPIVGEETTYCRTTLARLALTSPIYISS